MKTYTVNFCGYWIGGSAVVVANDKGHAKRLFLKALEDKLPLTDGTTLIEKNQDEDLEFVLVDTDTPGVIILDDGEY